MNAQQLQQLNITQQFEGVFKRIQIERMEGVPVINPQLSVQMTALQSWQTDYLGVLITPWFMNLILLPVPDTQASDQVINETPEHWDNIQVGQEICHTFPSGRYTFIVAHEEAVGFYQSCSLFSPMFEFENQAAAELTAYAALAALFDQGIQDIEETTLPHPAQEIAEPPVLSRRDFLRGKIRGGL